MGITVTIHHGNSLVTDYHAVTSNRGNALVFGNPVTGNHGIFRAITSHHCNTLVIGIWKLAVTVFTYVAQPPR